MVSFDRRYCSLIGLRIDLSKVVAVEFGAPGRVSGQGHPHALSRGDRLRLGMRVSERRCDESCAACHQQPLVGF